MFSLVVWYAAWRLRWYFRPAAARFSLLRTPLNQPEILECYRLFRYSIDGFKYFESMQKPINYFKNEKIRA